MTVFRGLMDGFYGIVWALIDVVDGVLGASYEDRKEFCDETLFGHTGSLRGRLGLSSRKRIALRLLICARGRTTLSPVGAHRLDR